MSTVKLTVNGKAVSADVEDRTLLVHLLRENLNLEDQRLRLTRLAVRRPVRLATRREPNIFHLQNYRLGIRCPTVVSPTRAALRPLGR